MKLEIVKGQPLQLPDGSMVLPEACETSGSTVVSAETIAQQEAHKETLQELESALSDPVGNEYGDTFKRTLADVDVSFPQFNAIMLVVSYTLWGLDSFAISRLMDVDPETVDRLKLTELYEETLKELAEAIRYAEQATVHGYLAAKAKAAAITVASSLTNPSNDIKLAAAKDILDRAGFRPVDRVEHHHKFDDELRIRYVSDETNIPTIDLEAGE